MIIHIQNKQQFEEEIKNNTCLVDFFATWCGPCKMIAPVISELDEAGQLGDIHVLKIDVDEVRDLAIDYKIQAVPTIMLIRSGKVEKTNLGYMNENEILNFIK